MRDDELRSQIDYSEGQREAANRVLVEIVNILNGFQDDILIVGGWVPELLIPNSGHIGSIDVDVLLNHQKLGEASYLSIERILLRAGYEEHSEKFFTFVKRVTVEGVEYAVDVDIMAGMYGGTSDNKRSQHVQGLKALKATGGNFAFQIPPSVVKVQAKRPDGAKDVASVKVVSIVAFLVMKTAALGRGKPKDAYDIYFCVKNYPDGLVELAEQFKPFLQHNLIINMMEKLGEKFESPEHAGPQDVVSFLELSDPENIDIIKRDVSEYILELIRLLKN